MCPSLIIFLPSLISNSWQVIVNPDSSVLLFTLPFRLFINILFVNILACIYKKWAVFEKNALLPLLYL